MRLAVAGLITTLFLGGFWLWRENRQLRGALSATLKPAPNELSETGLWPYLFDSNNRTYVVVADSSLSLLQQLTRSRVSLPEYVSRSYLTKLKAPDHQLIARLQFTSLADVDIATRIAQSGQSGQSRRIEVRYARNLETRDFNANNHILLGGRWSNPWQELFAESKNFRFEHDWSSRQTRYRNKSPQPGEQESYFEHGQDGASDEQYGVISFLPNLSHTGNVLIIEGSSMEGTEAAWELVSNPTLSSKLLAQIGWTARKGKPLYFEVLFKTGTIGGAPKQPVYVTHRLFK